MYSLLLSWVWVWAQTRQMQWRDDRREWCVVSKLVFNSCCLEQKTTTIAFLPFNYWIEFKQTFFVSPGSNACNEKVLVYIYAAWVLSIMSFVRTSQKSFECIFIVTVLDKSLNETKSPQYFVSLIWRALSQTHDFYIVSFERYLLQIIIIYFALVCTPSWYSSSPILL